MSALVFYRVDYCNSSLAGLPAGALAPLQLVLNVATRFVADLRPRDHVTSVQRSLHWLPIRQRKEGIQYKLCSDGAAHDTILPVRILNVSIKSPRRLRLSSEYRPNLVSYGSFFRPLTILVALLCTVSRQALFF